MAISAPSDLFTALERSDFDSILGTAENDWLDFKLQPYGLASKEPGVRTAQGLELAKDVSALANGRGGVIVVGFRTEKDPFTALDIARECSPVRRGLVNFDTYTQVIEGRTYPPIREVRLRWWPEQSENAVLTIEVPAAQDFDKPILTLGVHEPRSRHGLLLGIFQRPGDRVRPLLPAEVHARLRLGQLLQESGLPLAHLSVPAPGGPTEEERGMRLAADIQDGEFSKRRHYFLQAWPLQPTEVTGLHAAGTNGFRYLLARPPTIRQSGYHIWNKTPPDVLASGGIRTMSDQQVVSLEPSGLLTWVADLGDSYLAIAVERRVRYSIFPLGLVESTLEFVRMFTGQVLSRCNPPVDRWGLSGGMAGLLNSGEPTTLAPGREDRLSHPSDLRPARAAAIKFGPWEFSPGDDPGTVAFKVLKEIYLRFGIDSASIPYADGQKVLEEQVRNPRHS